MDNKKTIRLEAYCPTKAFPACGDKDRHKASNRANFFLIFSNFYEKYSFSEEKVYLCNEFRARARCP